jgi:hypothetical protein
MTHAKAPAGATAATRLIAIAALAMTTVIMVMASGAGAAEKAAAAGARGGAACGSAGRVHFLCGPTNAEDMVGLLGTPWIITSGMAQAGGHPGALYLVNARTKTSRKIYPVGGINAPSGEYPECPGAPDPKVCSAHGVNIRLGAGGNDTLYVINHGGREVIELFKVNASARHEPRIRWIGWVILPQGPLFDGVAALPDGGFLATKLFDSGDRNFVAEMKAGQDSGDVYRWTRKGGVQLLPGTRMSGANGIEVSPDGRWFYVNAFGAQKVIRFALAPNTAAPTSVQVDILPDNIRWGEDGSLLVAGMNGPASLQAGCNRDCPKGWKIIRIDPNTMQASTVFREDDDMGFRSPSVALRVGDDLWVGTFAGDRIAYISHIEAR